MAHIDHLQLTAMLSYQFKLNGVTYGPARDYWREAVDDAVAAGAGKWGNSVKTVAYLKDQAVIVRVTRGSTQR